MPGIPRRLVEHSLNILKGFKPVKQTLRRFSEPKRQAIGEELAKLLEAGFIRDIKHPDWLANLVMVPKKDKSWRLCVDFTDLNKACPKDPFPLPRIDQIIDATAGHNSLCFPRCILWLPPNQDGRVRPSRNGIHHPIRPILLQHDALRAQKCRRNISAHDSDMSGQPDRQNS